MTSPQSLFSTPAAEITLERVRDLVSQSLPESLTLECKEKYTPSLVTSVAAMANSYGGTILLGVKDHPGPDRLVGIQGEGITQAVNACQDILEPPWQPEIIPVPLVEGEDLFVAVIRVDPSRAPRPLLIKGAAPVRLHGRNSVADRSTLARLFLEPAQIASQLSYRVAPPQLPTEADGTPSVDFMIRSGIVTPVDQSASWRPFSEGSVNKLVSALNESPAREILFGWCNRLGIHNLTPFRQSGFNRATHVRLVWQGYSTSETVPVPLEAIATVDLPRATPGATASTMQFTLDVLVHATALLGAIRLPGDLGPKWRIAVLDLYTTVDGILAALTSDGVVGALADLARVDPVVVPQPPNLDFFAGRDMTDLLYLDDLLIVPDAGPSRGANLVSDPSLDLRDPADRREQVDAWLQQLALDSGIRGMEALLVRLREQEPHT